jgi:alpha-mannosidase
MENHPHDSICGCSIDQVHDEMEPRFDQVDQIGEEITKQALQALAAKTETQKEDAFSSIVLFNPQGLENKGMVEVDITIPEDVKAFEIVDEHGNVIPHEFIGAGNEEYGNMLLPESALRDTIGAISEGWVAGLAIIRVDVTRKDHIVTIDALMDNYGPPNVEDWQKAEELIAKYESDPTVTHYHLLAYSPMASRVRIVSPVIPALGWRTLWLRDVTVADSDPAEEVSPLLRPLLPLVLKVAQSEFGMEVIGRLGARSDSKPPYVIENEFFKVEASKHDGTVTVHDKHTGAVYTGLNRFVDGSDAGDEYNYAPLENDLFYTPRVIGIKASPNQMAPSLEISLALKIPAKLSPERKTRTKETVTIPIVSRVTLTPGVPRINVHTEIDNLAEDHRLRVHFPAPFAVDEAAHDGHYEVVNRKLGVPESDETWQEEPRPEVPQRAFTDVSNGEYGLMIANRGLPEVEVIELKEKGETEIALTLIRSVGWLSRDDMAVRQGHAGPAFATPGGQVPGKWNYEYAIIPHRSDWKEAYQQAYAFETSLRAIETELHGGEIEASGSFVSHSPAEFVISAVKESEDGNGWLVRGYNISSKTIQLNLKPLRHFLQARQINLAEEEIDNLKINEDGSVTLPVTGHQIVSILFSD